MSDNDIVGMVPVSPFGSPTEQAHYFAGMVIGAAVVSGRELWSLVPGDSFAIEDQDTGRISSPIDREQADTLPKLVTLFTNRLGELVPSASPEEREG